MTDDNHRMTRLQGGLAIASFAVGTIIAVVCLFFIPPVGEITTSAISIVSELLILCGSLLGIKVVFDLKMNKFANDINEKIRDNEKK